MFDDKLGFLTRSFLQREWALDFKAFQGSEEEAQLLARLKTWSARPDLKERSSEGAFVQTFFVETWGYQLAGRTDGPGFTAWPGHPIATAGAGGGSGEADLALGWFGEGPAAVPQALCEFKDIRSSLDAPQARKGNTRSPVKQCLDYVAGARRPFIGNEPILPLWGVVTDMNEFRLYWWDRAPEKYLRFVIRSTQPLLEPDLTADTAEARFDRFVFWRLFQRDQLLSRGGRPALLRLWEKQGSREKELEGEFYADYRAVRERLFNVLRTHNPEFPGTPGRLLRLAQKILDRFIFTFYCEDMGERMLFRPQLISDLLKRRSLEDLFDEKGDDLWRMFRDLFRAMNDGDKMGRIEVRKFNGGLFKHDPEIDALNLPNHVFCGARQGANPASIEARRDTLLHLSASYDYAARGDARESITLYTLGRIFEQSITWLEIEEARLEGRTSLAESAKRKMPTRKSQGVYYTPEWVVEEVVKGTMGPWFAQAKRDAGWAGEAPKTLEQLEAYEQRLANVRIVDPACGSGAFLIGAFRRLLNERLEAHGFRQELTPGARLPANENAITAEILDRNLFGVDISAAAVEIAKLAVWLHSARADAPLSSLDNAIVCGNSLVGPDYYKWTQIKSFSEVDREQVNAFDWKAAFPHPQTPGQFDIVLGNPPYVKLQNLKEVSPDVADYLVAAREDNFYASTQSGNFDLYLPFIEKGLRLLRAGGRMGYIAPSLWTVNEYGEALRKLIRQNRNLACWVDFKSHQIFKEVTTYTALQFFSAAPNNAVIVAPAPGGETDLATTQWSDPDLALTYERLPHGEPWLMATGEERNLIDRLAQTSQRLDDRALTTGIIVGIQTSADGIYHLERVRSGLYRCHADEDAPYEVEIEDAIMRPLISGAEAKRYEEPQTDTWLIFPYAPGAHDRMALIPTKEMARRFPKAWTYLKSWEKLLRKRENRKFDGESWYQFGRNQNIDKQNRRKLLIPRIVTHLKSSLDRRGEYCIDNVDVGGVIGVRIGTTVFLNGVLNGGVADYVFRRLSKPFANDYRSANKQFIAPLPVPKAGPQEQAKVARGARKLQRLWTQRREFLHGAQSRLGSMARARYGEAWLWPTLSSPADLEARAPQRLKQVGDRRQWAQARAEDEVQARLDALQAQLKLGGPFEAVFSDGELRLLAGGVVVLGGVFLDPAEGELTRAYWRWLLLEGTPGDAAAFAADLRRPPTGADSPAARQFMAKVEDLAAATASIEAAENEMNNLLFDLYELTVEERSLVLAG